MFQKWLIILVLGIPTFVDAQNVDLSILNKNYSEALIQIDEILADTTQSPQVHAELFSKQSYIYKIRSEYPKAIRSLEQSIVKDSTNSRYLNEYADLQVDLGNWYKAIEYYLSAINLSPDDLTLKYKLARIYTNVENFAKAFDICSTIRMKDSTNIIFNKQYCYVAMKLGKANLAIRTFNDILEQNPDDYIAYVSLIPLYANKKDADNILRISKNGLGKFPNNSIILLREANALFSLNKFQEAKEPFEQYLSTNDSLTEVMKNYGITLFFCKDEEKAAAILDKCYQKMPNDPFINFYLGLAYRKVSDYTQSIGHLKMAIVSSQSPYLAEMYHQLGQVYGLNRDFEKSIEALKKVYQVNNEETEVLFEIATTYEEFKNDPAVILKAYSDYLTLAGDKAKNTEYALARMMKIKEGLFLKQK